MRVMTNELNLPGAYVRAVSPENDKYDRGTCEFTATELIKPPRILRLKEVTKDEKINIDVMDSVHLLFGKAIHAILEHANRDGLVEKRFYAKIDGRVISSQIDTLSWDDNGAGEDLLDWKTCTIYQVNRKGKFDPDWASQVNIQLECLRQNGLDAKKLFVVPFIKDFSAIKAMVVPKYYPISGVLKVELPLWPREQTVDFIKHRMDLHDQAKIELPECTDDEHWGHKRCLAYGAECAPFCDQWKKKQKEQANEI